MTERKVDNPVIVTLSASSALNREHHPVKRHIIMMVSIKRINSWACKLSVQAGDDFTLHYLQFEYDPPGEEVTTNNVTPMGMLRFKIFTIKKPTNGMIIN